MDLETMVRDDLDAMGGRRDNLLPGVSLAFGGYEWRARTDRPLAPTLTRGVPLSLRAAEAKVRAHGRRWGDDLAAWKAKLA